MALTAERAREVLHYNPAFGILVRRCDVSSRARAGAVVGSVGSNGYLSVCIDGTTYSIHRIVWLIVHGEFPKYNIDHINGNKVDNRLVNLRDVPHLENCRNKKKPSSNTSGVSGVYWNKKNNKWCAQIKVREKQIYIGSFDCKDKAAMARRLAEEKYGFHENHGRG